MNFDGQTQDGNEFELTPDFIVEVFTSLREENKVEKLEIQDTHTKVTLKSGKYFIKDLFIEREDVVPSRKRIFTLNQLKDYLLEHLVTGS